MRFALMLAISCLMTADGTAYENPSEKALADVVSRAIENGFTGAVLVKRGEKILVDFASGAADGVPLPTSSPFWIASVGKTFVSAAILKLVDQGEIALDQSIAEYLPSVPVDKQAITIRQLLAHASGFPQSYVAEQATNREEALKLLLALPLEAAPGEKFVYSNANYQLAAALIETATGRSYDENLEALVNKTGLVGTGRAGWPDSGRVTPIDGELPVRLRGPHWGEQGVYSTAHDLVQWYEALTTGRFLSPQSVEDLFKPVVPISVGESALGWFLTETDIGHRVRFVRGNEDFGANALVYAYPDDDVIVVVLTHAGDKNSDLSWSRAILADIEGELFPTAAR